jgi:hypothetical protein
MIDIEFVAKIESVKNSVTFTCGAASSCRSGFDFIDEIPAKQPLRAFRTGLMATPKARAVQATRLYQRTGRP